MPLSSVPSDLVDPLPPLEFDEDAPLTCLVGLPPPPPAVVDVAIVKHKPFPYQLVTDFELSDQSRLAIDFLVSQEAFSLDTACAVDLEVSTSELRERGLICQVPGVENKYMLELQHLELKLYRAATTSTPLIAQPLVRFRFDQASKLLLLQSLFLKGFKPKLAASVFFEKHGPLHMCTKCVFERINYARCLMLSDVIWSKTGSLDKFLHSAPDEYYKALLKAKDLTVIAAYCVTRSWSWCGCCRSCLGRW